MSLGRDNKHSLRKRARLEPGIKKSLSQRMRVRGLETATNELEQKLEEAEQRYRNLVENI